MGCVACTAHACNWKSKAWRFRGTRPSVAFPAGGELSEGQVPTWQACEQKQGVGMHSLQG
eukprot:196069-Pelagomonas_calceolata.AAC.4